MFEPFLMFPLYTNCLNAFVKGWVRPFGWPKQMAFDRGTHNRGIFWQTMSKKGVRISPAALESPEQIGRVEWSSQTLKHLVEKIVKEKEAAGPKKGRGKGSKGKKKLLFCEETLRLIEQFLVDFETVVQMGLEIKKTFEVGSDTWNVRSH